MLDELTDEDREWLNANLNEETNIEWDEYGNPSPIIEEEPKQTGVPVMVDPKTGKFFYEEPDTKPKENVYGEDPSKPVGLDLDGDGVVEEEEVKEVFEQADTNNDGVIDKNEAKTANLDEETSKALNEANEIFNKIDNSIYYPNQVQEELGRLKQLVSKYFNKKKDDDTITYF